MRPVRLSEQGIGICRKVKALGREDQRLGGPHGEGHERVGELAPHDDVVEGQIAELIGNEDSLLRHDQEQRPSQLATEVLTRSLADLEGHAQQVGLDFVGHHGVSPRRAQLEHLSLVTAHRGGPHRPERYLIGRSLIYDSEGTGTGQPLAASVAQADKGASDLIDLHLRPRAGAS